MDKKSDDIDEIIILEMEELSTIDVNINPKSSWSSYLKWN